MPSPALTVPPWADAAAAASATEAGRTSLAPTSIVTGVFSRVVASSSAALSSLTRHV